MHAISVLVEAGKPCEQVLHQLGAVRAALDSIGARLLVCQLEQSKEIILHDPIVADRAAELEKLLALYIFLTKYPIYHSKVNL